MPTWNLLADHYGKIPHSEHITIAKVGEGYPLIEGLTVLASYLLNGLLV